METSSFSSIDPRLPAGAQIFEAVKYAILRMDLAPGQLISESDIAEQFGASRTPVREALQQLRSVGLLMTKPSRGNYVTLLSRQTILEAQFLREAIEVANIQRVCEGPPQPHSLAQLQSNLAQQSAALQSLDERLFSQLDDEFHVTIAKATGYPRAAAVLEREKILLDRLRALSLNNRTHLGALLEQHSQIYQALEARDSPRATALTRQHLQLVLSTLSTLIDQHADYFEDNSPSSTSA